MQETGFAGNYPQQYILQIINVILADASAPPGCEAKDVHMAECTNLS